MKYIDSNIVKNIMIILPAIATLLMFCYVVQHYAVDIPQWDDYDQSLNFLINYTTSNSVLYKVLLLVGQHNEHRIVLVK